MLTVGYVAERVGETDIGLAKLNDGIVFSYRFLDIDTSAKTLLLLEYISREIWFLSIVLLLDDRYFDASEHELSLQKGLRPF
jgi:hypothetical protein